MSNNAKHRKKWVRRSLIPLAIISALLIILYYSVLASSQRRTIMRINEFMPPSIKLTADELVSKESLGDGSIRGWISDTTTFRLSADKVAKMLSEKPFPSCYLRQLENICSKAAWSQTSAKNKYLATLEVHDVLNGKALGMNTRVTLTIMPEKNELIVEEYSK